MAVFEIQGQDGSIYEVDAPDEASAVNAFRQIDTGPNFNARFQGEGGGMRPEMEGALVTKAERDMGRPTRTESAFTGAAQGLTFNLADEAASGINAAIDYVTGQAPDGIGAAYDKRLATARQADRDAQAINPVSYTAGNVAGTLAPAVATGGFVSAPNLLVRALQGGAVGAGMGGLAGFGAGEGAEDRFTQGYKGAVVGGALGAAAEPVMAGAGALLRRGFGASNRAAPGVVPEEVVSQADEFGIPLTRGQATGDVTQQAFEEAARNDARGPLAGRVLRGFDDRQSQAIDAAKASIAERLGGEAPETLAQGGDAIALGLRNRADELRAASDEAYGNAARKGAAIAIDEVGRLGQKVAQTLADEGINLETYGNYPGAQAAMNLLRRVSGFEGAPAGENVVAQSLQGLEQARKALLKVKGGNGEDYRALRAIRDAFDGWLDDAIDNRLFSGDATALDDLKQGRELWSKYKGLTNGKKGDALPVISKMMEEGRTGEEVANWLMGAASAGQAGRAARVAVEVRKALGADSQEWQILRQMAWQKATTPARGAGSQALTRSVSEFTKSPLARQLFSPEEIGQMRRYAAVVGKTVTDPRATNRGQSGYEILRSLGVQGGLGAAGAGGAYATGDARFLALAAIPLFKNASSLSKGVAATRALPSTAGNTAAAVARPLTYGATPLMIGQGN